MQPGPCNLWPFVVLRANLKPEAPLSALLATNNEIGRFLRGREHDQTARCFIDTGHRKYSSGKRRVKILLEVACKSPGTRESVKRDDSSMLGNSPRAMNIRTWKNV